MINIIITTTTITAIIIIKLQVKLLQISFIGLKIFFFPETEYIIHT